jgi:hypothetical protein
MKTDSADCFPARGNLELLDVDPIGENIWLIGHDVDQSRRGTGQGKTDLAGGAPP